MTGMLINVERSKSPKAIDAQGDNRFSNVAILDSPVKDIVREANALEVGKCLIMSGAYGVMFASPVAEWPKWKNGIKAPVYCNCRALNALPLERKLISSMFIKAVENQFSDADAVVGMATAGIAWARSIADALDLPLGWVRTHVKSHGYATLVEGNIPVGSKVVLIDDLVASGGSVFDGIVALREETKAEVLGIQSIVNWGFRAMRRSLTGYRVRALTSYPFILVPALRYGLITEEEFSQLLEFYDDPTHFRWPQLSADEVFDGLQPREE